MSRPSIAELRRLLQDPRKPHDTPYGKVVMRTLSIYITAGLIGTRITPLAVTLVSVVAGLFGVWELYQGHWISGILWVNAWYLLDHVDGELARYRKTVSVTGLYFDTIANAIVQPLAFAAMGVSVWSATGDLDHLAVGLVSAYASLMLLVIPYCEAAVLLQWTQSGKMKLVGPGGPAGALSGASFFRRAFSMLHFLSAFPSILPILTLATLAASFYGFAVDVLALLLWSYAVVSTVVWVGILVNLVISKKLESKVRAA